MEIAELGLSVRSDGVVVADRRLEELEKQSRRTEKASERMARQAKETDKSFEQYAATLRKAAAVTAAVAAAGGFAVKQFADFETALVGIAKVTDLSAQEVQKMGADIRAMSTEMPFAATEIAALAEAAGRLGVTGSADILKFAETVSKLGTASDISGEEAATALARILNVSNEANSRVDVLASSIVALGNTFATGESQIAMMTTEIARGVSMYDVASEKSAALASTLAALGVRMQEAGSGVGRTFRAIESAIEGGGENMETLQRITQMTGDQLRKTFQEDAIGVFQAFTAGLGDLPSAEINQVLDEFNLGGERIAKVIPVLARRSDEFARALQVVAGEVEETTALNEEYERALDTTGTELTLLKNTAIEAARVIGAKLAPAVREASEETRGFISEIIEGDSALQSFVEVVSTIADRNIDLSGNNPFDEAVFEGARRFFGMVDDTNLDSMGNLDQVFIDWANSLREAKPAADSAAQSLEKIEVTAEKVSVSDFIPAVKGMSEAMKEATAEGKELTKELTNELALWGMNEAEALRFEAALVELNDTYGDASDEVAKLLRGKADLIEADREAEEAARAQEEAQQALNDRLSEQQSLYDRLFPKQAKFRQFAQDIGTILNAELGGSNAQLGGADMFGMSGIMDLVANFENVGDAVEALQALIDDFDGSNVAEQLEDMRRGLDSSYDEARRFEEGMELLRKALDQGIIDQNTFDDIAEDLERVTVGTNQWAAEMERGAELVRQGFQDLQSLFDEGTEGFQAMAVAADAANLVRAIGAVINQGMGDPYTAFSRMAAMAAAVSQLGYSVGAMSSNVGLAQERQETQGTGTVLGMPEQQSESISNALEITADATSELVGINRGMLNALNNLNEALTGATTALARGFGEIDFGELNPSGLLDDFNIGLEAGDILGIFSGEANVIDEGIRIAGGTIQELINNTLVEAFRDTESRSWILDDFDMSSQFEELGEEAGRQFQLIFQSIADTVIAGAEALGLSSDAVSRAVAEFEVEAQRISLMDLDAEEQQEQIEAVFSRIFDDLASSVVPFIDQFQQVGEGLGETLIRVATSVQVVEEAVFQLGFAAERIDPEQWAQLSVGLVEAAGGLDAFISGMQTFVDAFASDLQKFQIAQSELTRAFEGVNLEIPETRQGMWDLMQSLNANTESGREQIATLLELADVADEYYSHLERIADAQESLMREVEDAFLDVADGFSEIDRTLMGISRQRQEWIEEAEELGMSEAELARIREVSNALIQDALDDFQRQRADFLSGLDDFRQSDFERGMEDIARSLVDTIEQGRELGLSLFEMSDAFARAQHQVDQLASRLEQNIRDLVGKLYGTPLEQLDRQISDIQERYMSGSEHSQIVGQILLDPLIAERDRLQQQQEAFERAGLARNLAQSVADLAGIRGGDDFSSIADEFGFSMADLARDLGIDQSRLDSYLQDLQAASYTLDDLLMGMDDVLGPQVDRIIAALGGDFSPGKPIDAGTSPSLEKSSSGPLESIDSGIKRLIKSSESGNSITREGFNNMSSGFRDFRNRVNAQQTQKPRSTRVA